MGVWPIISSLDLDSKYYNPCQHPGRKFMHNFSRNIKVRSAVRLRHRALDTGIEYGVALNLTVNYI